MPTPRRHAADAPALEARNVYKRFPGVQALDDVSITVYPGEVVGLVGENGSGKSTLLSTVSGAMPFDSGTVFLHGEERKFRNYVEANRLGLFRAHQDQGLIDSMSVVDNMYLGHERSFSKFGLLRRGAMRREAQASLDSQVGSRHIDARAVVGDLALDSRQLIEIVRAFALAGLLRTSPPVVMLDETTASLNLDEVRELYKYIDEQRKAASFLFVSHRLEEIFDLCDWIYVLKDGKLVTELNPADANESVLHSHMVGRVREELYYKEDLRPSEFGEPLLELVGLAAAPHFTACSLSVRSGEIVTLGGVTGSGKSELARAVAGDLPITSGDVRVAGRSMVKQSMGERTKHVGYGPLDRHREGVSLNQSIALNVTLSALDKISVPLGFLSPARETRLTRAAIKQYNIGGGSRSESDSVGQLSGGNQQKVMLARLVAPGPRALVLDNPTRGVDAGARQDIYEHLRRLTREGTAILMITDDMQELIGMADRIATMKDGRLTSVFDDVRSQAVTEEQIVATMM